MTVFPVCPLMHVSKAMVIFLKGRTKEGVSLQFPTLLWGAERVHRHAARATVACAASGR